MELWTLLWRTILRILLWRMLLPRDSPLLRLPYAGELRHDLRGCDDAATGVVSVPRVRTPRLASRLAANQAQVPVLTDGGTRLLEVPRER
jgi:hypothetical protein